MSSIDRRSKKHGRSSDLVSFPQAFFGIEIKPHIDLQLEDRPLSRHRITSLTGLYMPSFIYSSNFWVDTLKCLFFTPWMIIFWYIRIKSDHLHLNVTLNANILKFF